MRGTVPPHFRQAFPHGITPACAGNSVGLPARAADPGDHPRVCGEQSASKRPWRTGKGSPPRVRGTGTVDLFCEARVGITPACAGNSAPYALITSALGDHPRVCGEQQVRESICGLRLDHPRVCGEQHHTTAWPVWPGGSPPRVRGTVCKKRKAPCSIGITPACAGNRKKETSRVLLFGDHPRVCGEQFGISPAKNDRGGSPPRVRGTGAADLEAGNRHRITPACAGNSRFLVVASPVNRDHPRVCGEQTKKSPSFLHSFLSDQENSFSLKYNCSISSQSFCARWTSLQGSSKCFAKVDS